MRFGMISRIAPLLAVACLSAFAVREASAQSNSMFGSSGPLSGTNGFTPGSGGSGSSSMFGSGGTGMGAAGAGMGGIGMGGAGMGATGMGTTGTQLGGTTPGQRSTFVGQPTAAGNRFVGQAQAGTQQVGANRNQTNLANRGATGRGNGAQGNGTQNQNGPGGQGAGTTPQRVIRPQQRIAFNYNAPSAAKTSTTLNTRFKKLSDRVGVKGVTIEASGSTVTLSGNVDSEDTKRLAAMLAGLEPGVRTVNNKLTVKTN